MKKEKNHPNLKEDVSFIFYGLEKDLDLMRENLISRNWKIKKLELCYKPKNLLPLNEDQKASVQTLYEALLKDEDTHRVYLNVDLNGSKMD